MEQIRSFQGGMNLDDSPDIVGPEDWIEAFNIAVGRSYTNKNGEVENLMGTIVINSAAYTDLNSRVIGYIKYSSTIGYVFFWNSDPSKHCILKLEDGTVSLVLQWSGLDFQNDRLYRINGGGVADDCIYFTDNYNPPRCVHLTRYSGGSTPSNAEEILHIKRGPQHPPYYVKSNVTGNAPLPSDIQIAYQYEYSDGQLSVLSPWTDMVIIHGANEPFGDVTAVHIGRPSAETVPSLVTKIRYVVRRGLSGTPHYIGDDPTPFGSADAPIIDYYGQNIGVVDSHYEQPFELVPLLAGSECITKSRIWFGNFVEGYDTPSGISVIHSIVNTSSVLAPELGICLSRNARFAMGVVLFDDQGRAAGVIDMGTFETTNVVKRNITRQHLEYQINGTPPAWASSYALVVTKDIIKSAFYEGWGINALTSELYVMEASDGTLSYSGSYTATTKYLRLHMLSMNSAGIFYSFVDGDKVIITHDTTNTTYGPLRVRKIVGDYLFVDAVDLGASSFQYNYQIYTPNSSPEQLYYEIGQRRTISGGVMDTTDYLWEGDCIARNVNTVTSTGYNMSQMRYKPNDGEWNRNIGRPFIKNDIGQVTKTNFFKHSSTFIQGAAVNGLSEFSPGDEGSVPLESIKIQKLQPTTNESTEGDVILAICNNNTHSIYVNESRLSANDQTFVVATTNIVGDVRKQQSGFGTVHPESVLLLENGQVCWFDYLQKAYVRYSTNGIFPISEYKAASFFEVVTEANNYTHWVVSGYDPYYKIIYVVFQNAHLERKIIGFSLIRERWISFYNMSDDLLSLVTVGSNMYSIISNVSNPFQKHTKAGISGQFYGTVKSSSIKVSFNDSPGTQKEWKAIMLQGMNDLFSFSNGNQVFLTDIITATLTNERNQSTNILYNEFEIDEGNIYGEIRGDIAGFDTILTGDAIYSDTLQCKIEVTTMNYVKIKRIMAGCEISRGHNL